MNNGTYSLPKHFGRVMIWKELQIMAFCVCTHLESKTRCFYRNDEDNMFQQFY